VAKQLLGKSLPVRAVLRSASKELAWQANGAITLLAGLQDASALEAAFDKATAVFIMTPPLLDAQDPMAEHDKMLAALSIALYKTRPKKLVFLSSIGAHLSSGTGAIKKLYDLEQCFRRLPIPTMSIRAAWFMENFFGGLDIARQSGYLPSFLDPTDAAIPMIATHDIGVVAAKMLQSEWTGHHNIELEGPCRYSADDVASILSSRFKRDVTAKPIPAHLYEATYRSFGFTPAAATMMAEMHNGFNSGHIRFEGNGQQHFSADTLLEDVLTAQLPPI
jgi:uncharacterized protein YbjT (DUF2867 family)